MNALTTAGAACAALARRFAAAGLEAPRLEAELLAAHVLGAARLFLRVHPERELNPEESAALEALAGRRLNGEPVAYLLGTKEFYGRDFEVAPGVLVPRPETELLVDTVLECRPEDGLRVLDACAGSGCIGITLSLERPSWHVVLLELMPKPAAVCRGNIQALSPGAGFVRADLFALPFAERSFNVLVSNPPYVALDEADEVQPRVLAHEPREALFSGADGLTAVRALCRQAAFVLRPGGLLALEHGWRQGAAVRRAMAEQGFCKIFTKKDLAGLDRVTAARI